MLPAQLNSQDLLYRMKAAHPLVLSEPERVCGGSSAWTSHIPFAFWLMLALRPRRVVELGTHVGVSYSAFCQAARALNLETEAYAVDTWQGDEHAGYYGDEIYDELLQYTNARFGDFSHLLRMTFDEALDRFEDSSIDLLHIDGLHTYDAVKHDFDSWRPKLTPNAIVLFHDTQVRERGFGVWRLFEELAAQFPSFDFLHGHGLGVICLSRDVPPPLDALLLPPGDQLSPDADEAVQTFFATLGNNWVRRGLHDMQVQEAITALQDQIKVFQIQWQQRGVRKYWRRVEAVWAPLRKRNLSGGSVNRG